MVEEGVGPGDVAGVGGRFLLVEGADPGPRSQHPHVRDAGDELVALLQHQLHLPRLHREPLRVGDSLIGGSDHGDGANGDDDVAVGGHLAAVHHGVEHAVIDGDHGSLPGLDHELDPGSVGDAAGPGSGGVHHHVGGDLDRFSGHQIVAAGPHHPVPVADQGLDLVIGEEAGSVLQRRGHRCLGGHERVGGGVGYLEAVGDAGIQIGLAPESLGHRDLGHVDAGRAASLQETGHVVLVVPRGDDEEAPGLLDAMGHDPAQDPVLLDALHRRLGVLDHVAASGVEETVIATGGAVGEISLLDEKGLESAHRQVSHHAGSGGSAPDDEDLGL